MSLRSQVVIDDEHPWPGLAAFDESAERFFNGRAAESAELRRIVLQAPLAVLFGVSGLGKSSLLQAGLFPLLRRDNMLPVLIRLDFNDRSAPLIDQVRAALQREFEARHVEAPAFEPGESLWEYLHRSDLELWSAQNQLLTPVFALDQFEEVFTLGADEKAAVRQLKNDLANLVENRLPPDLAARAQSEEDDGRYALDSRRYRFILSFREDYLPAIEGWKREMPSILKNRLRLLPMSGAEALRAIHDTAPRLTTEALARDIMIFVAKAKSRQEAPDADTVRSDQELSVEPSLLSLVCHGLNEKRLLAHKPAIDAALLQETGPSIVTDFYRRSVGDMPGRVRRFIETELITERGFRKPFDVDDASRKYGITSQDISRLVERRLLRIEPFHGSDRIELTHDLLTGVVREQRDQQRALVRRRRRTGAGLAAGIILVGSLVGAVKHHENADFVAETRRADSLAELAQTAFLRDSVRDLEEARSDSVRQKKVADSVMLASRDSLERLARDLSAQKQAATKSAAGLRSILTDQRDAQIQRAALATFDAAAQRHTNQFRQHAFDSLAVVYSDSLARSSRSLDSMRAVVRARDLKALHGMAIANSLSANADTIPFDTYSRLDLFDLRGQSRPIKLSPGRFDARQMFGDSVDSRFEPGLLPVFFELQDRDSAVVEWTTASEVELRSVALFAQHDGVNGAVPPTNAARVFSNMTLAVMAHRPGTTDSSQVVATYAPTVPYAASEAWGDEQPGRSLSMCLPLRYTESDPRPIRGSRFRFMVKRPATSAAGPRIVELDGYAEPFCGFDPRAIDDLFAAPTADTFAKRYARSTIAIGTVLGILDGGREYPSSGRGADTLAAAVRFLSRTADSAWNQQLARHAGSILRHNPRVSADALWSLLRRVVPSVGEIVAADMVSDSVAALLVLKRVDALADEQLWNRFEAFARAHPKLDSASRPRLRAFPAETAAVHRLTILRKRAEDAVAIANAPLDSLDDALVAYRTILDSLRAGHSPSRQWSVREHASARGRVLAERRRSFQGLIARARSIVAEPDSGPSVAKRLAVLDSARQYAPRSSLSDLKDYSWLLDQIDRLRMQSVSASSPQAFGRPVTGLDVMRVLALSGAHTFAFEHDTGARWILFDQGEPKSFLVEYKREQGNVFLNDVCAPGTRWQLNTAFRQVSQISIADGTALDAGVITSAERVVIKSQGTPVDTTRAPSGLNIKHIRATAGRAEFTFDEECPKRWTMRSADKKTVTELEAYKRYQGTILLNDLKAPDSYWQFNTAQGQIGRFSAATGKLLQSYSIRLATR